MSMEQALTEADQTNPQLLAARAQLRQMDEGVPEALSGWRPHVSVVAQGGPAIYQTNTDATHYPERRVPQDYELRLTQNLYTSGRVHDEVAQAKVRVLAGRATLAASEALVLLTAGSAYLDVVRDRDILALDRNQEIVVARTVTANRTELAAGAITQADLAQSEARLARQKATTSLAATQLAASEASFQAAVGESPGLLTLPDDHLPLAGTREQVMAQALQSNPELQAARRSLEATRLSVDIARDQLLPIISISGLVEHQREYEYLMYNQRANAVQTLLQIIVPLYQGGAEYARIRAAKEGNVQAQELVEQAERQARRIIVTAWSGLVSSRDRVVDADAATRADRVAETGLGQQQAVGARTTVDLLNAEQETLSSMVSAVSARHDVLLAELVLLGATGQLDAATLLPSVRPYDPAAHYDRVHGKWFGTSPPNDTALAPIRSPEPGPTVDRPARFR